MGTYESLQIQKLYSSARYVSFALRLPGKTIFMFWGRGKGFEGVWFGDKQIESPLRKRDQFLEYLRKHLTSTRLVDVEIDSKDRILILSYYKAGQKNKFALFYNGRNSFFAHYYYNLKKEHWNLFKSWDKQVDCSDSVDISSVFDEVGRTDQKQDISNKQVGISELLLKEKKDGLKSIVHKKEKKFLNRKRQKIENDLNVLADSYKISELIASVENLETIDDKVEIGKIKFKFKEKEHYKRRDELYLKIKKLKKAKGILELRLKDTEDKLDDKRVVVQEESILDVIRLPIKTIQKNNTKKIEDNYVTNCEDGIYLGYGLSAQGNDQLRKQWANKTDIWFHADGESSAHVIVRGDTVLNEANLKTIGKVLIELMKKDTDEINVIYTQVKNLKGVKGSAGSVTYKKEKHIKIYIK